MAKKKEELEKADIKPKKSSKVSSKSTETVKSAKTTPAKKATSTKTVKKTTTKNVAAKKTTEKKVVTKKATAKKVTSKKSAVKKRTQKKATKNNVLEYYDLPYTYNKTFVKILAQTPNTLFVYWEVSEEDKKGFIKKYGEDFFNNTYPVLIVHNKTKNYSFDIEINDFANSWYFNVNDTKCEYEIEYGRKIRSHVPSIPDNYIYIASSNEIESPNDHILFEKEQKSVFFKSTKTNYTYSKDIANLHFIKHLGNLHRIYDFYNRIYETSDLENIENPSSNFSIF